MNPGPLAAVPVDDAELLARFIFTTRHIRDDGGTITAKAEAFAPFKHVKMSVTRHRGLSEEKVWDSGAEVGRRREVSEKRKFPLVGRADFLSSTARNQNLDIVPEDPPLNHADVVGWPPEKPAQMIRALELAIGSQYISNRPIQ